MRLALIDYGAGNLASVRKGFAAVDADLFIPDAPSALENCSGMVIPGVGHFAATARMGPGMRDAILRRIEAGVPLLGICLGMQLLFEGSDEAPGETGLGLLSGRCARLVAPAPLKVPHVGWNTLGITRRAAVLDGVESGAYVYFTHTFAAPVTPACAATADHGRTFAAAVERGHISGVQFHPEKSGDAGLRILANFVAMTRS